ncbi:MAG TPA: orotidine-5'-phosphate decarboxylase [Mycobacteriales bacterium]|jgi:orotidine-5'-phosphate decarboxylase|nr:orotidine-5'-phosphate decarboxylase [Mycobacteriales bacterium]
MVSFGDRLAALTAERGPLTVGIDPHLPLLRAWGLPPDVDGLERFAMTVVGALGDRVAVFKPQSAFFERFGSRGIAVLERLLAAIREAGALSLIDVKRGDIGSTTAGYAAAYLDPASPLAADAMTASPYLGFGSLRPLLDAAYEHGRGVFVLALTSNPEGAAVQRALAPDGRTVAQTILDEVAAANAAEGRPLGSVGVVVGATVRDHGHRLDHLRGPILAPGLGAQGAGAGDLPAVFGAALPDVLPAVSRELLAAGPDPDGLRAAAGRLAAELGPRGLFRRPEPAVGRSSGPATLPVRPHAR